MTTLILRKDKSGAVSGKCDARCYTAKGKKCHCVCGGFNHGMGLNSAIIITSTLFKDIENLNEAPGISIKQGQLTLFEEVKS